MTNFDGAWLRFIDADKMTLAFLPWDPLVGIAGAFFGDAHATGRAATWEIQFPDGRRARGVSRAGNIFPDEPLRVERRTVEDWMGELSSAVEPAPEGPPAFEYHVTLAPLPSPERTYDLTPLANLATAVAWGLVLERVVTEWRAWHPAARVSWDVRSLSSGGMGLRVSFAVDGLGVIESRTVPFSAYGSLDTLECGLIRPAQASAALAMAPHYVAPAPKPENRDAALRRFADGVTR